MEGYTFYTLTPPFSWFCDDGEGEDHSEWFTSLQAARARRSEISREDENGEKVAIQRVVVSAHLSPKAVLLAVLNRKGWMKSSQEVVPGTCCLECGSPTPGVPRCHNCSTRDYRFKVEGGGV